MAGSSVMFLAASFFTGAAGSSFSFLRRLYGTKSRTGPLWGERQRGGGQAGTP